MTLAILVRLTARIMATLILAFMIFMIVGHLFGDEMNSAQHLSAKEITSMALGLTSLLGLILAYFREGLGGLIAIISAIAFFICMPQTLRNIYFQMMFLPGPLYLLSWYLHKTEL